MLMGSHKNQAEVLLRNYVSADSFVAFTSVMIGIFVCKTVYDLGQLFSAVYFKSYLNLTKSRQIEWSNRCSTVRVSHLSIFYSKVLVEDWKGNEVISELLVVMSEKEGFNMENGNGPSSCLSFASSSYLSNGSSNNNIHSTTGPELGTSLELLSLSKLSSCLENLVVNSEYDYSDAEIVVEGVSVGVNRCILAARSDFFHELFKKPNNGKVKEGKKPKFVLKDLLPHGKIGYEAFMVILSYMYTGKLRPSPPEVSTCVDESCAHDACGPAINYAVEMMYASVTFRIKELIMVVQRRLMNFIDKAFVEDIIPILTAASLCHLSELLSHCLNRIARSDLDDITVEKELPPDLVNDLNALRPKSNPPEEDPVEAEPVNKKRIRRIHQALDSDDVELVKLLLEESGITLDESLALHYAAAYCNPKVVNEVLNIGNADVNLRNSRAHTVLHVAARRKDPSVVVGLLNKGARVSDLTSDGRTAVTIVRRLTRPKDLYEATRHGQETNTDRLCVDVLEREIRRDPLAGAVVESSMMVADDLHMRLLLLENRVAMARSLFPLEAKVAMQIAHADSTLEFAGLSAAKGSYGNFKEVDLNEIPSEQVKRLHARLQALQKTVDTGRRFFPNCSEVLDQLLEDDTLGPLLLEKGSPEEQRAKRMRYMELKQDLMKAFNKDIAEKKWTGLSMPSSCSNSAKVARKR
ncbi:ankyrin repeat family protein [Striga asiatica]|uniref:Ankyrin repeat family protein n=1 Tax=Striga asiatica TaxID=4170 RepID=A0A5A7PL27_STRAF|nr:ankyrin repeat family protein [Striga asiatica]